MHGSAFEHSSEPENFVDQCYDLLRPGGVFICAVPSDFTPAQFAVQKQFGLGPWYVSLPDHQWYPTPKMMQLLLRRCGFQQRYMRMTFPLVEKFILEQGRCYVGNSELGRECHRERMAFEMEMIKRGKWKDLEARYIANVEQRVGREIIAIFQKPY